MRAENKNKIKKTVDICMAVVLLVLFAYQVTGEPAHEWAGVTQTVLVIIHQILNRKWYTALFKGKYNAYRIVLTIVNVCLIISLLLTAFCGMSMSGYAVPFFYGMAPVSTVREIHLAMSHWTFVLMGLHLGLHIPSIATGIKIPDKTKRVISVAAFLLSVYGLYLFIQTGMPDYLFFQVAFAFLDYDKALATVFFENLMMLLSFVFIGTLCAVLCRGRLGRTGKKQNDPESTLSEKTEGEISS